MSQAAPAATPDQRAPSPMTRVAAILVVLALAGIAAYAVFSGPTTVPAPAGGGTAKPAPSKAAPPSEERAPEPGEGARGD